MDIVTGIYAFVGVLKAVKDAVDAVTDVVESVDGLVVSLRKTVDDFKNTVTEVVVFYDSDGDGENDTEQIAYRIYQTLPDYETGFCICNKDGEIGLGMPMFEIIDGRDFLDLLVDTPAPDVSAPDEVVTPGYPVVTGNDKYLLVDLDNDGCNDVISPAADLTGDGINDWFEIVDYDGNGLPDASPNAPFYTVGSDAFNELVGYSKDELALTKPFEYYSVPEALLFVIAACALFFFFKNIFKRRKL